MRASWSAPPPSARARLAARVGERAEVLVDSVTDGAALARSAGDAPEIDGVVRAAAGKRASLRAGDWAEIEITGHDTYDLTGRLITE